MKNIDKLRFKKINRVLKALKEKGNITTLEGEVDYDDERGIMIEEISEEIDLDLTDGIHVRVDVKAKGDITGDAGDYENPPSYETEWGELEYEYLEVWVDDEELEMTEEQEIRIWLKVKENINFN